MEICGHDAFFGAEQVCVLVAVETQEYEIHIHIVGMLIGGGQGKREEEKE